MSDIRPCVCAKGVCDRLELQPVTPGLISDVRYQTLISSAEPYHPPRDRRQNGRDPMNSYLTSVAPVSIAIAASVVCAAFRPSRKSLSLYVEYRSVGWCHCGSQPAPICAPRSFSRRLIAGDEVLERPGVGVGHVLADARRIVGRVLLVRRLERPTRASARSSASFDVDLELDVHVGLRPLLRAHRAVGARHAVVEHHHVVLDHAEPFRLGILAGARRVSPCPAAPARCAM